MYHILRYCFIFLSIVVPAWKYGEMKVAVSHGLTTGAFPWFFGRGVSGIEDAVLFAGGVVALFWLTTTGKVLADRY